MTAITNTPPTYGTSTVTWEGYVRADEILPGDVMVPEGAVDHVYRVGSGVEILSGGNGEFYEADEALYVERTVVVTVRPVGE